VSFFATRMAARFTASNICSSLALSTVFGGFTMGFLE
jgi:hypothetical protein